MTRGLVTIEEIQELCEEFKAKHGIKPGDGQFKVHMEENGELAEALATRNDDMIEEELADVLYTTILLGEVYRVDPAEKLREIAEENLNKSTSKEGDKITDDR